MTLSLGALLLKLFAFLRPPLRDESAADAFARHGYPDQGIPEILKSCGGAGLKEADEEADETESGPFLHGRSQEEADEEAAPEELKPQPSPATAIRLILDSGATCHAVGDVALLSSLTMFDLPGSILAAYNYSARDGRRLAAVGVGDIATDSFRIPNVRLVPGLAAAVALVSVTELAERDCRVVFGGGRCSVKHRSSGELLGQGSLHPEDGLYHLDFLRIPHGTDK